MHSSLRHPHRELPEGSDRYMKKAMHGQAATVHYQCTVARAEAAVRVVKVTSTIVNAKVPKNHHHHQWMWKWGEEKNRSRQRYLHKQKMGIFLRKFQLCLHMPTFTSCFPFLSCPCFCSIFCTPLYFSTTLWQQSFRSTVLNYAERALTLVSDTKCVKITALLVATWRVCVRRTCLSAFQVTGRIRSKSKYAIEKRTKHAQPSVDHL